MPGIYENINNLDIEKGFYELINPPAGGEKVCLVSTGYMTQVALKAAQKVQGTGVVDVFILKPVDKKSLFETLKKYQWVITIEEGFINSGGLDSLISEIILENNCDIRLKKLGLKDKYLFDLGDRNYLHGLNNLDEESIIKVIKGIINQTD